MGETCCAGCGAPTSALGAPCSYCGRLPFPPRASAEPLDVEAVIRPVYGHISAMMDEARKARQLLIDKGV